MMGAEVEQRGFGVVVVVPNLNQGEYLDRSIESVLDQSLGLSVGLVVADGGSTDGSLAVIERWKERLACFWSETDGGQADAIARGWDAVGSRYVSWLNADDVLLPDSLAVAIDVLERNQDVSMVYRDVECIDSDGVVVGGYRSGVWSAAEMLLEGNPIPQPGSVIRRRCLVGAGGLNRDLQYFMDFDLWVRLAIGWPLRYVPGAGAQFRLHSQSKTGSSGRRFWSEAVSHFAAARRLADLVGADVLEEAVARFRMRGALEAMHTGRRGKLRETVAQARGVGRLPWGSMRCFADRMMVYGTRPQYLELGSVAGSRRLMQVALECAAAWPRLGARVSETAAHWCARRGLRGRGAVFAMLAMVLGRDHVANRGLVRLGLMAGGGR